MGDSKNIGSQPLFNQRSQPVLVVLQPGPVGGVKMARYKMYFNPAKAVRELGLPQTPPRQALADAAEWFYEVGTAKRAGGG